MSTAEAQRPAATSSHWTCVLASSNSEIFIQASLTSNTGKCSSRTAYPVTALTIVLGCYTD